MPKEPPVTPPRPPRRMRRRKGYESKADFEARVQLNRDTLAGAVALYGRRKDES